MYKPTEEQKYSFLWELFTDQEVIFMMSVIIAQAYIEHKNAILPTCIIFNVLIFSNIKSFFKAFKAFEPTEFIYMYLLTS